MNREIKFRAWDSFNEVFYYSDNMKSKKLSSFFECCEKCIEGGNEIIYQQYTGLKDKNGKEIYEGDMIRIFGEYVCQETGQGYPIDRIETVTYVTEITTGGNLYSGFTGIDSGTSNIEIEVIGNIYEIELLDKQLQK